ELFTSFFFVSVGMMLNVGFFFQNFWIILLLGISVFLIKALIAAGAVAILKYPPKTVILTGLALFQVGEFAFILSKVGIDSGLISQETNQYFLSVSILTMLCTPFVIIASKPFANKLLGISEKIGLRKRTTVKEEDLEEAPDIGWKNHLVIIGYGSNGQNLARAAAANNIPFVVLDLNAKRVKQNKDTDVPIIYGDATDAHILESVNIHEARAAVITLSDINSTKNILKNIRTTSQTLYVIVKTRYDINTSELFALGANDVIPEELETSIKIFSQVLENYLVPEDEIHDIIERVRVDNYGLLTEPIKPPKTYRTSQLAPFHITALRINSDSNKFLGKPLDKLHLRAEYGINVLAIMRQNEMIEQIDPNEILKQGDLLYIQGNTQDIEEFHQVIK
ncbi:MAG TPA: NAD-binding protein, partial [Flavobacteriaceae bacterium]|nr:NAD-binding protein [Flavobacteriaceae bacterium]